MFGKESPDDGITRRLEEFSSELGSAAKEVLTCLTVLGLPADWAVLSAVAGGAPFEVCLRRAAALGLIQVEVHSPSGGERFRLAPELRTELADRLEMNERREAAARGALCWFERYWLTVETCGAEEAQEYFRLAELGNQVEVALNLGLVLAQQANNAGRPGVAVSFCRRTLRIVEDYRLWHQLGLALYHAEKWSSADQALERALELCPASTEQDILWERGTIVHHRGMAAAAQLRMTEALGHFEAALALTEQSGNTAGKAVTLREMGLLFGRWAGREVDALRKTEFLLAAVDRLAAAEAWPDLYRVLTNLAASAPASPSQVVLQALWLGMRVATPAERNAQVALWPAAYLQLEGPISYRLAAYSALVEELSGEASAQWKRRGSGTGALRACAEGLGITTPEAFDAWVEREGLRDPERLLRALERDLENQIPRREWRFDRSRLPTLDVEQWQVHLGSPGG